MLKEVIKDPLFLSRVSLPATEADLSVCEDLRDTLAAHRERCVGMAANMIGVLKRIIIVDDDGDLLVMLNPEIIKTMGPLYEADEGCMCHQGTRKTKRYAKIKVRYQDEQMKVKIKTYQGFTAQIIQHEIDHCQGILI